MGALSIDCLAWLAFLFYRCAQCFLSTPKCLRFPIRWSTKGNWLSSSVSETGSEFATGRITLGDIIIAQISSFEEVWSTSEGGTKSEGVKFFKPVNLPPGFHCVGYYSEPAVVSSRGWILVVGTVSCTATNYPVASTDNREDVSSSTGSDSLRVRSHKPALARPLGYQLVWSCAELNGKVDGCFWLPTPPDGYKPLGYVVSTTGNEPSTEEVMCVRTDLTDVCSMDRVLWAANTPSGFKVTEIVPSFSGTVAMGISVGSFFCGTNSDLNGSIPVACLKSEGSSMSGMPSLAQVATLMSTYGPTVFFHSDEKYFPSSVAWFFSKGPLLYSSEGGQGLRISADGSNLPVGGSDDDNYWIDLPNDGSAAKVAIGDLSTAEVYVHAKSMQGATFTDLALWLYYPFNGAGTAKVEWINLKLGKIGEHVSDWEHVTLRINNFTGQLQKVYFAQHSGGVWLDVSDVEYIESSRFIVYSSKHGHASYPHPGLVLQGEHGVGIRNDMSKSKFFLDTSRCYQVISAEYLNSQGGNAPKEPQWLQYMRKWGPRVQYNSVEELEKVLRKLPSILKSKLRSLANKFPDEVFGEEGPTGPKEKASWFGDEKV